MQTEYYEEAADTHLALKNLRITALQAENEKLRELLGECDWLLKWANEHLMAFSNMRLETEFFSRREHAIERIQAALEPKP